jgi:hypothetical protein
MAPTAIKRPGRVLQISARTGMHDLHPLVDPFVAFGAPVSSAIGLGRNIGW